MQSSEYFPIEDQVARAKRGRGRGREQGRVSDCAFVQAWCQVRVRVLVLAIWYRALTTKVMVVVVVTSGVRSRNQRAAFDTIRCDAMRCDASQKAQSRTGLACLLTCQDEPSAGCWLCWLLSLSLSLCLLASQRCSFFAVLNNFLNTVILIRLLTSQPAQGGILGLRLFAARTKLINVRKKKKKKGSKKVARNSTFIQREFALRRDPFAQLTHPQTL